MAIYHAKTSPIADMTGTVTVFNSQGSTTTANATDLVRPSDYNSAHAVNYALGGNTAGSASVGGADVAFFGGNNVTLSADTANSRIYFSGPDNTQFLTTAMASNYSTLFARTGFTTTTGAGSVIAGTNDTAGLKIAVPAFLTTAAVTNITTANVATSQSSLFQQTSATSNITSNAFPSANTTKFAGTGTGFTGANISATITHNSNGLSLSLSAPAAGAVNQTGPNIAVAGATITSGTVMFSNSPTVTFGMAGSTITASAAGGGGGGAGADRYFKEIVQGERLTTVLGLTATNVSNRPIILPFFLNGSGLNLKTARVLMSFGPSSNRSIIGTVHCGIYSMANSDQMTLLASDSWSISMTNTASSASYAGPAWVDFTGMSDVTLTTEGRYAIGLMVNPNVANTANWPVTLYGADNMPNQSRIWSNGVTSATNASYNFVPFWGVYSTTTNALPNSMNNAAVNGGNSASQFQFYAILREI